MNKLQSILVMILLMMGFTSEIVCGSKKPAAVKTAVPAFMRDRAEKEKKSKKQLDKKDLRSSVSVARPIVVEEPVPTAVELGEEENDPEDLFGDSAEASSASSATEAQESSSAQEPTVEELPTAAASLSTPLNNTASTGKIAVKKAHKKAAKKPKAKGKHGFGAQLASIRKAGFTAAGHTALIKLVQDLGASVRKLRAQVSAQANRLREVEFRTGVRSKSKTTLRQQLLKKRAAKK